MYNVHESSAESKQYFDYFMFDKYVPFHIASPTYIYISHIAVTFTTYAYMSGLVWFTERTNSKEYEQIQFVVTFVTFRTPHLTFSTTSTYTIVVYITNVSLLCFCSFDKFTYRFGKRQIRVN